MLGSNLWGTVLGRLAGVPVVIAHEHGSPDEVALSRRVADRYVLGRGVDAYLAVCEPDRRRLVDAGGVPEERTRILANGILTPEVDPSRDMRAELGLPADAVVVGTVGILRKEKAHHVLVRAAARVREHHPELHVVIVGDGVERMPLEELAEELGIRDAVHFIGVRADVPQVLTAFDIAANSSDREGSPLSVMEYMEARLPVVATRVGAVPEIVRDGVHGRVVPPGDPEAMAGALRELLGDRERAAEMGRRGQERRRSEYDLDVVASRLGALYEELWAARSARSR
jgi:glycosyltransferase involved in cell wall biosynthesis